MSYPCLPYVEPVSLCRFLLTSQIGQGKEKKGSPKRKEVVAPNLPSLSWQMQFPPFSGGPQSQHSLFLVNTLHLTFAAPQVPTEQRLPWEKKKKMNQEQKQPEKINPLVNFMSVTLEALKSKLSARLLTTGED